RRSIRCPRSVVHRTLIWGSDWEGGRNRTASPIPATLTSRLPEGVRALRFGLFLGPWRRFPSVAAIGDLARAAEDSGFAYVALGEHLITPEAVQDTMDPT